MDIPVSKVRKVLKIAQEPISLETPIGEEEDSHLGDFIEDRGSSQPIPRAVSRPSDPDDPGPRPDRRLPPLRAARLEEGDVLGVPRRGAVRARELLQPEEIGLRGDVKGPRACLHDGRSPG